MEEFKKIKNLLVITLSLSEKNGTGRYSLALLAGLRHDYKIKVFTGNEKINTKLEGNIETFPILPPHPLSLKMRNPFILFRAWKAIIKETKNQEVDFVHSFMDYPFSLLACLVAKQLKKPLLLTSHGTYSIIPFNMWPDKWLNAWVLKRADKIICVSRFTEKEIKKYVSDAKTIVINNGIDFNKFQKEDKPSKNQRPTVMSVGWLKHRKGFHVLIEAMAKVKIKYPNFLLYIIGDQSNQRYLSFLQDLIQKNNLQNNVEFYSEISDDKLIEYYYRSHIFALTSINYAGYFEGFGLVFLEAGACGLPVVGTRDCGIEDAIIDGQTGYLVRQENVNETAAAILKLLDNPVLARQMGEAGKNFAKKMDWDSIIKKYRKICYD